MEKWDKTIVDDLERIIDKSTLNNFVSKYWERFIPVYINFHGYCADNGELYLLVHNFISRIVNSDVQPVFKSDNQLFSYFKTAVKNKHYDNTHKKEVKLVPFEDYFAAKYDRDSTQDTIDMKIPDFESIPFEDMVNSGLIVEEIFRVLEKELPESCMAMLILMYKEDLSPVEVKSELGLNITTVRDRIGVIREAMDSCLGIVSSKKTETKDNILLIEE